MNDKIERYGDVDLFRGFGILLMVMGHVWFGDRFNLWIHAFHMPMWFIISGFFFHSNNDPKEYVTKKIRVLIVPYLFFSVGYELIWTLAKHNQWMGILFPNTIEIPLNGALWFLPAMFFADMFAFFVLKYIRGWARYVILAVVSIISSMHFAVLPLSIDSALTSVGFILIGYLIKQYGNKLLELRITVSVSLLIAFSGLAFVNGIVNVRLNTYSVIPLFYVNAVGITISLWNIFKWIEKHTDLRIAKEIGAQSLLYVCANQFILNILVRLPLPELHGMILGLWNVTEVMVIIVVCFVANRVIMKTPLKVVLGK